MKFQTAWSPFCAGQGEASSSTMSMTFGGILPSTQLDSPAPHFLVRIRVQQCLEMPIANKCGSAWRTSKRCDLPLLLCTLDVFSSCRNLCSPRLKCFLPWSLAFLLETISCYRDLLAWKCAGICPRYRSGAETHIGKSARETYLESSMSWLDMFMPWFWNNKLVKQMSMWSMFMFWSWSQVWGCMAHPGSATWL